MLRRCSIPLLLSMLLAAPAFGMALTGRVVDSNNKPVEGASVCYRAGNFDQHCVQTDATGAYLLRQAPGTRIRVTARGFIPHIMPAVDQPEPIVLKTAASIKILLVDAESGEPIPKGTVWLIRSNGRKVGPFPPNAQGVQIGTLEPGEVVVQADAEGYQSGKTAPLKLVAGKLVERTVRLRTQP